MNSMPVLQTKDKVQRFLSDLISNLGVDSDGDFHFRHGSARIFVRVREWGEESTIVRVFAPTNFAVPPTPELFRYLVLKGADFIFGRLDAVERDDGVHVYFAHTLLGDYLDPDELKTAAIMVAKTADELDNEIKDQFGGGIFHDD